MVTPCAIRVVADFCCSLCRLVIIQGEYLIRIAHSSAEKLVMLGVMEVSKRGERKQMKQGTTVGFIAMLAGVLLATVTSVSANHAATGKGTYAIAPQVLFQLHFVVATEGLNVVQSEFASLDGSISFQSTVIDSFTISTESAGRTVTIIGAMVSTTILGVGPERRTFAELVPFAAIGVDKVTPEAGADLFSLIIDYNANQTQGQLFASLGLGVCQAAICTITFTGPMETGDIFVHTSGGD
jgi:hypothetical protein